MENVVLVVHLILALCLIGAVLLQRSEGGGLGMGGGGGAGGGVVSGRAAATAMGKITWALAIAFIATSISLTVIAAKNSADSSVLDRLGVPAPIAEDVTPALPGADDLLPPTSSDAPATPPRAD
ncbi:MAG: preprotein translocase subunit SecG [Pseudoruegeria sp.]